MIRIAKTLIAIVFCCVFLIAIADQRNSRTRVPLNFLLITIDTLRADHLGCYGARDVQTPNLDALARQGNLFNNFYSAANGTSPSHLSMLSGRYVSNHGIYDNGKYDISSRIQIVPGYLKQKGYRTYGISSVFFLSEEWLKGLGDRFDQLSSPTTPERTAQDVTAQFHNLIPSLRQGAFFAWIHFYDPHIPYQPPQRFERLYDAYRNAGDRLPEFSENDPPVAWIKKRGIKNSWTPAALYKGEVSYVDEQIGEILRLLKTSGVAENTVVIVASDHGEFLGERGIYYNHGTLYEPIIHVPLIIYNAAFHPGKINELVSGVDIAPTILDLAGLPVPQSMDGVSLSPLLHGRDGMTHDSVYAHAGYGVAAARITLEEKLIFPRQADGTYELYDLTSDPGEDRNIFQLQDRNTIQLEQLTREKLFKEFSISTLSIEPSEKEALRALGYTGR